jgi:hypothetical protein
MVLAMKNLLGSAGVAKELGVLPGTVYAWKQRGDLPEPDAIISGRPAWELRTIKRWYARYLTKHPRGSGRPGARKPREDSL